MDGLVPGTRRAAPDTRDRLIAELDRRGVETRPFFVPIPELPPYAGAIRRAHPVSTDLARRGLNLPTYGDLTNSDVDEIVSRVRQALSSLAAERSTCV
ncbi:DegT/DnrJ/EryC1/StrS family aminotransferase [Phytohabitans suffuscus]|uniref:DegT/DnrJ/EryC1/StrS family aminotransferase n=1 Tax=Phytohabitans suffuscus TaxID=624315 RepID=UPI0038CD4496